MKPMEAISEGEWSCLSDIYTTEEAHFMAQLLENAPLNTHLGSSPGSDSGSFPAQDSTTLSFMGTGDSSFYPSSSFPHPGVFFSSPSGSEIDYLNLSDTTNPILETGNDSVLIGSDFVGEHNFLNPDPAERNVVAEEKEANEKKSSLEMSGKRSRSAGNRMKMNAKLRKGQSLEFLGLNEEYANANHDQETNAQVYKRSSSTCCSGDNSGVPQGQNGGSGSSTQDRTASSLSGKMRASRGSATDPQSLYARKRRERINERLKILQSLVPNGTKVDISTMLEEAVHYVKFLQLQIKLLSSDDLWMYAPIAYNGIDIGLDLKINPPRQLKP